MPTVKAPSLFNLQKWMRWTLTHPSGVSHALAQPHPLSPCINFIGQTPEVNRAKRLSIYGNGYFLRLIEVLGFNFSSLKNIVGEEFFDDLARRYLVAHPSTYRSIDDVGNRMPEFLVGRPLAKRYPFLPDLAAVEWAAHQSFFADDAPLLDLKAVKKINPSQWPRARIALDTSVHFLKTDWPVDELWRDDGEWLATRLAKISKKTRFLMIFRLPQKIVRIPSITSTQYHLLTQFQQGKTLSQALASLKITAETSNDLTYLQRWFEEWTLNGVIRRIEVSSR